MPVYPGLSVTARGCQDSWLHLSHALRARGHLKQSPIGPGQITSVIEGKQEEVSPPCGTKFS